MVTARVSTTSAGCALIPFLQGARPVLLQEPRDGPVGEEPAPGLTGGAVVHFVFGIPDALHRRPTHGARLAEAAVHGHPLAECSHLFRKRVARLGAQSFHPRYERV